MRTKTLLLTAALSAAGIATSMAQVYSVNAVGYVNTPLVPGYNLVSNPLDNKTGNTIQNLFGTGIQGAIPNNLTIYYFNPDTDSFVTAVYDDLDGAFIPASAASTVVAPGNGVFVRNPNTTGALVVTFVGEVPQGAASNTQLPQGFSIKASTVPVAGTVTELQLPGAQGDRVFEWNATTQAFVTSSFDDLDNAWLPAPANISVGEAFFLFKAAAGAWNRNFTIPTN
jgi:hypothetical protein